MYATNIYPVELFKNRIIPCLKVENITEKLNRDQQIKLFVHFNKLLLLHDYNIRSNSTETK